MRALPSFLPLLRFPLAAAICASCLEPATETVFDLPDAPKRPLPECQWAKVLSVTDGDTVRVEVDGTAERLRYIGIDSPELRPEEGTPEPFADDAAAANEQLVAGEDLCLESDVSDRDRFGRLLRYAWLEDGTMVNEALVLAGLAEAVEFRPDTMHHDSILQPAEDIARAEGRGIWR